MKKILTAIVALFMAAPSFAQFSSGGFSIEEANLYYGVRIGMTVASISGDIPEVKPLGSKVGLTLAGVIGLRVSNSAPVFLESGLYYTERGAKKEKVSVGYNTLEIPIVVKYGFKVADEFAILPFLGPTFSQAISGKYKATGGGSSFETGSFEEKDWSALKRFNMGFKVGCGAEYSNLYLELAYQLGITNICKDSKYSGHSNAFLVNFGVNF